MSILAAELIVFGPASRPIDDVSTSGGAIDLDVRPSFTQIAATDNIEVLSSNVGDTTQTLTVQYRNAAGAFLTENINLNGTTPVTSVASMERVLGARLGADAAGIVTVRRATGDTLIGTIPIAEREFYASFRKSASAASPLVRYEKVFCKNTNGSLTLNDADVTLTADPDAKITIGLAATKDDTGSVVDRLTAPGGVSFSDDNVALAVPGATLESGVAIGTWVKQSLIADDVPYKSSYTLRIRGTSI
jgi:hypothetical protein